MNRLPVAQPSPIRRFRLPRAAGAMLALTLVLGGALALAAAFVWPGGGPSPVMTAGEVRQFEKGSVTHFEKQDFFLVRLDGGTFLALSDKSSHLREPLEWRPDFEFVGQKGWFVFIGHWEIFAKDGTRVAGPAPRDMDRFPVLIQGEKVKVATGRLICGPGLVPAGADCQLTEKSTPWPAQ